MTNARKWTKNNKNLKVLRIATWNVRGLCNKEDELMKELTNARIDIAVIPETKKKLQGSTEFKDYILLYSGVSTNKLASAGAAIMIHTSLKKYLHSYTFINKRIIQIRFKFQKKKYECARNLCTRRGKEN